MWLIIWSLVEFLWWSRCVKEFLTFEKFFAQMWIQWKGNIKFWIIFLKRPNGIPKASAPTLISSAYSPKWGNTRSAKSSATGWNTWSDIGWSFRWILGRGCEICWILTKKCFTFGMNCEIMERASWTVSLYTGTISENAIRIFWIQFMNFFRRLLVLLVKKVLKWRINVPFRGHLSVGGLSKSTTQVRGCSVKHTIRR